ncbi:MAG: glycosyltransferase family 39 protein [Planctomycetes bacterium]|nr:glycosyltransferase family 39 protein [Planctomycetota bacterium]
MILLIALVLRVMWVLTVQPDPNVEVFDDSTLYVRFGRGLVDGEGYNFQGEPTAGFAPAYAAILAATFVLPGDDMAATRVLHVLLGLGEVLGVYYLASRLWDRRAGLLAAAMMALFPSHIFFTTLLMREPVFSPLLVGLLCLAVAWTLRGNAKAWQLIFLGVAAAFMMLMRFETVPIIAVIVLSWVVVHRSWRRVATYTALLVLGMAALLVPWIVRNAVQVGSPVITTGGWVLLVGSHHPDSAGYPTPLSLQYDVIYHNLPQPERALHVDSVARRDAINYAIHHIPRELSLVPDRLSWFFRSDHAALDLIQLKMPSGPDSRELSAGQEAFYGVVADTFYYAVAAIMVLGLPFWIRRMRGEHILLFGTFAVYCAMWAFLFAGLPRYHYPLIPIIVVLAAIGLSSFWEGRSPQRASPPAQ